MSVATGSDSVLERKLAAARREGAAGARSILRALRLAVARAATDELGLQMAVIGATQSRCALDALPDQIAGDRLYLLLTDQAGRRGGLTMDAATVSALVQQQTTGAVRDMPPAGRPFTDTDAALVATLVDSVLPRAAGLVDAPADRACLEGLVQGQRIADARGLVLGLRADRFRVIELAVDIGGGQRQGRIGLVLADEDDPPAREETAATRGPGLEQGFGAMRAELTAVIGQVPVPLSHLSRMAPGDLLPLVRGQLDETRLVAIGGRTVATGRLGQAGGLRAVRLRSAGQDAADPEPPLPDATTPPPLSGPSHDPSPETPPGFRPRPPLAVDDPPPPPTEDADAYEEHLMSLTPEQASLEISQLAGLPAPDSGPDTPPEEG